MISFLTTFGFAGYFGLAVTDGMGVRTTIETKFLTSKLSDLFAIGFILYLARVCYFVILQTNSATKFVFILVIFLRIFLQ